MVVGEPAISRLEGPGPRLESGVLPTVPEAVAAAVHLEGMDAVDEAVQQDSGQSLQSKDPDPSVKGQGVQRLFLNLQREGAM